MAGPNEIEILQRRIDDLEKVIHLIFRGDRYIFNRPIEAKELRSGPDGLSIGGTTAGKVGFYDATPVDQPLTVSDPSIATVSGSGDDANINNNFAALDSAVESIIDRLQELGLIA